MRCMHVCSASVNARMHAMHAYMFACLNCIKACIYARVRAGMDVCAKFVHARLHACICVCMHVHACPHAGMYVCNVSNACVYVACVRACMQLWCSWVCACVFVCLCVCVCVCPWYARMRMRMQRVEHT